MLKPKTKTIRDLYEEVGDSGLFYRCLDDSIGLSVVERKMVDKFIKFDFNSFKIFDMFTTTQDLLDYLTVYCHSMAYKWKGLIDSTKFDYDPIANVDGTETRTRLASDNFRDGLVTTVLDAQSTDNATTESEQNIATRNNTHSDGTHKQTTKDSVINSSSMKESQEVTNAHTANATDTLGGGKDTQKIDSGRTIENDSLQTVTNRESENFKEVFERHGNIGVTSTQNLIEQQRRVVDYNVLRAIAHDVALVICMP